MENTQVSILTALFGGKASGAAAPAGLFAKPSEGGEAGGQGFFSFVEGLLKPAAQSGDETPEAEDALGGPLAFTGPFLFDAAKETATGDAMALGEGLAPLAISGGARVSDTPIEGFAAAAIETKPVADDALATPPANELVAPGAFSAETGKAGAVMPAGEPMQTLTAAEANPVAAAGAALKTATSAALTEAQADDSAGGTDLAADFDAPRAKTDDAAPFVSLKPGHKPQAQNAGAANAFAALTEHASPEAFTHSAVTREEGGLEFDRLASTRLETAPAADKAAHVNPVRDQIVAAVTARHNDNKLEIRLDPPELGRVTIGFEREGAEMVRAVITADTPETLDLMRRNADVFARALEDQGFAGLDLHFSEHGPQGDPGEEFGGQTQHFTLSEEEAATAIAGSAPEAALGRLDRRL